MSEKEYKFVKNPDGSYMTSEQIKNYILSDMSDEEKTEFAAIPKEDVILQHHFGMGRWIRNTFGLWAPDHPNMVGYEAQVDSRGCDCNPLHPDAVSMDIVEKIHEELQTPSRIYDRVEDRIKKLLDQG